MPKKPLTLFLTTLLTLAFSAWLLSSSILILGGSDKLMFSLMRHYAPAAETGLPDSEYPAMAEMITDYLRGKTDSFQHTFVMNGAEYLAFNQKEQQHMADVQGLFSLADKVRAWGMAFVLAPIAMAIYARIVLRKYAKDALRGIFCERPRALYRKLRTGLLLVLGAAALLALWAAIDFDSLFILFHRIAFTNDLWLLDPRTDLLIRLMPTEFFVAYAALIGAVWATGMGLFILLTSLLAKELNA